MGMNGPDTARVSAPNAIRKPVRSKPKRTVIVLHLFRYESLAKVHPTRTGRELQLDARIYATSWRLVTVVLNSAGNYSNCQRKLEQCSTVVSRDLQYEPQKITSASCLSGAKPSSLRTLWMQIGNTGNGNFIGQPESYSNHVILSPSNRKASSAAGDCGQRDNECHKFHISSRQVVSKAGLFQRTGGQCLPG
ncbi:uncharacterized protein BO96DRAFT_471189 [Aspergillus niger CBS 101883]|uniref:uncharacterized protein n=1 Tax=Aspergillus lacticoffeatus (strain CBS 101883) TaxID=1450533 RepID=UPI000D7FA1D5|nr:uncharacterized protein BO96DRAFT_471189 [Aspergillus niger CBS 101883]PYH61756.1 hypothetical protein BO96DRAFT_471189 [Aspergillus niger CBS 101883]